MRKARTRRYVALGLVVLGIAFTIWKVSVRTYAPGAIAASAETNLIQPRLALIISNLAENIGERHLYKPEALSRTIQFVSNEFANLKYTVGFSNYWVDPVEFTFHDARPWTNAVNIVAEKVGNGSHGDIIIIGAHYDTMPFCGDWTGNDRVRFRPYENGTPGANDNGSGVAALLEIARLLANSSRPLRRTVRFIAFANEEPPFFQRKNAMGSFVYARVCKSRGERIRMMISLDVLGLYSRRDANEKRTLVKDKLMGLLHLSREGEYVAFMSQWGAWSGSKSLRWAKTFSQHSSVTAKTVSLPQLWGDTFAWSDDWSFTELGFPAFCVTDTAMYRSDRYHEKWDTLDHLETHDFEIFARVVDGLAGMIRVMADEE